MTPNGVLVVDKPRGPTSHDIVSKLRRAYGTRQVGHAGTLDPMATGVLVTMLGEATKLSGYLTLSEKSYRAEVELGIGTDTLDAEGTVTERVQLAEDWLSAERLERALAVERARTEQVPPAFSAIHVDGERAHEKSRRGEAVQLPPRAVRVIALDARTVTGRRVELELTVSKGYYVRSLARDLGQALGVPSHLAALRRTASGRFTLQDAVAWPLAEPPPQPIELADAARRALPCAILTEAGAARARLGQKLADRAFPRDAGGRERERVARRKRCARRPR